MEQAGKVLIGLGAVIVLIGLLLTFGDRLPFRLGRLPLDFRYERGDVRFYFPLGTSILVSLILTLAWTWIRRR